MMNHVRTRTTLTLAAAAVGAIFGAAADAGEIEVIFAEKPGDPKAVVPGALDLAGAPIVTEFKAFEDFNVSHDGALWLLKSRNTAGSDLETQLHFFDGNTISMFAQEGQPVADGEPGELYDFFDAVAGFDVNGNFAYGARAKEGDTDFKEKIAKYDLGTQTHTIVITESTPLFGLLDAAGEITGDEVMGNSGNSIHLLNDGRIGYAAITINNIHSSRRPALMYDDQAFLQSGVTAIDGGVWDSFDSDDFTTTPDNAHYLAQGDDEGATTIDDILVYDGTVIVRENEEIGKSGITAIDTFASRLLSNGDYFARGDDPNSNDWALHNGTVVAASGDPIHANSDESWGDAFSAFGGNRLGDWVLTGDVVALTTGIDPATDGVLVINNAQVLVREGDPVDLDGNGVFDDDAFIGRGDNTLSSFAANDVFLTDDYVLFFIAPLHDSLGNDLGGFGAGGEAFMRLSICPADVNDDNTHDVFDLLQLLDDWGVCAGDCPEPCASDSNWDCSVDVFDLLNVLDRWGDCP